jgi:hypothetical protein
MLYMVQSTVKVGDHEEIYGVCYDEDDDMFYNSSVTFGDYFSNQRAKFAADWLLDKHAQYPNIIQKISIVPVP